MQIVFGPEAVSTTQDAMHIRIRLGAAKKITLAVSGGPCDCHSGQLCKSRFIQLCDGGKAGICMRAGQSHPIGSLTATIIYLHRKAIAPRC